MREYAGRSDAISCHSSDIEIFEARKKRHAPVNLSAARTRQPMFDQDPRV
jgi:hypothetical protein